MVDAIFHYTTVDGLLGILQSGSLFATDYRYLNDASECSAIRELIFPLIERDLGRILPQLAAAGLIDGFFEYHGQQGIHEHADAFFKSMVKTLNDVSPLFLLSLCRHARDSREFQDGLLSQWRGYGGAGGFAIEFDEAKLDELQKEELASFSYVSMRSKNVHYTDHKRGVDLGAYAELAGEVMRQMFDFKQDISNITGTADLDKIAATFAADAPFLKHAGFAEEREYRIAFTCIRRSKIPAHASTPAKPIKFAPRRGLIVPYIELFATGTTRLPIKSIIVGPHRLQEQHIDSLNLFLETTKFAGVSVRPSRIPYRE